MKKLLLSFLLLLVFSAKSQTISIVGSGVNGWPPDNNPEITLSTTDNVIYTISNLAVSTGEVKFRQDLDWAINWGSASFPTGTGVQGGSNIPTQAGVYDVTFNRTTGEYSFVGTTTYPVISLTGDALTGWGNDINMQTTDGVTYTLNSYTFNVGEAKFRQDGSWATNWGSASFPSGTGTQGGDNIIVPGGTYHVSFNRTTGEYSFTTVSIGILGTAVVDWNSDTDMNTTDAIHYTLIDFHLNSGELKFRQDNSWSINWGGDTMPAGTGVQNGVNLTIADGNYDITFNRTTLEYTFTPHLGVNTNDLKNLKVYPNPSSALWNITSDNAIDGVTVTDLSGKIIFVANPSTNNFVIENNNFQSGMYIMNVTSGNSTQKVKLIKK
jgi:hypothetical protein